MRVSLKQLDKELPVPKYAYEGDAGCDLYSRTDVLLKPRERVLLPTGIAIALPQGYAGFVQPRSGLALKHGISLANTPGLIDCKYRGEVKVILINLDQKESFEVRRGDKVAQLVIQKVEKVDFDIVEELDITTRGEGGFGSSGKRFLKDAYPMDSKKI